MNAAVFIHPEQQFLVNGTRFSYTIDPDIYASWRWLNKQPGEPAVYTDSFITSFYLLSYTAARPYLETGFNTVASNQEIGEHFIRMNEYFGVPEKKVDERLKVSPLTDPTCWESCDAHTAFNQMKGAQHMFYNYFKTTTAEYRYVSKEFAGSLLSGYAPQTKKVPLPPETYIYYGPWEREFGGVDPGSRDHLPIVYENKSVKIYKTAQ